MQSIRIHYAAGEHQFGELRLPGGVGPHPVVVLIHGGFWRSIRALDLMDAMAEDLTSRGYATWNLEYRRVGNEGGGYPGTFGDVAMATDFLRELGPRYGLDLNRVVAIGHSAGGHLGLWLAGRHRLPEASDLYIPDPLRLLGVISLAGVNDLRLMHDLGYETSHFVPEFMGGTPSEHPLRYAWGSPAELLPLGCKQVLVHGTDDVRVPISLSRRYWEAARAAGDPAEYVQLSGADHFVVIDPKSEVSPDILGALGRMLA